MTDSRRNGILVFATYWNEIGWVHASLAQIDALDPAEVIICEGCFDPDHPLHSTDGTRDAIEDYARSRPFVRVVSPVRLGRLRALVAAARGHGKSPWYSFLSPGRFKIVLGALLFDPYRVNQALTFQAMIRLSNQWTPGRWFMTCDADQFYGDEVLRRFRELTADDGIDLICGNELTFFEDFSACTTSYERRNYNNMPHRIQRGTNVMPTRDIVIEDFSISSLHPVGFMKSNRYANKVKSATAGPYHHYKFRFTPERTEQGYRLGDRKAPEAGRHRSVPFRGEYPSIIRRFFPDRIPDRDGAGR